MASASTSAPDNRGNTSTLPKSHFQQTVCLEDWWLVKAENEVIGRRIAVGGLTGWGKQAKRVFTSAPILKRFDVCSVETTDGICVVLNGFINKDRTLENGFPSDVFNYFVFGFPPYWKECDEKFVAKEQPSKDTSRDNLLENLSPQHEPTEMLHVEVNNKYSASQGKTEAKGRQKSKTGKSSTIPLPDKCSVSGLQNEMKSLSSLDCGGSINKHADDSQLHNTGGTLFACDLNNKRKKEAADNSRRMDHAKKATNSDQDTVSPEEIGSHSEVKVNTRSVSSFRTKQINNKRPDDENTPLKATNLPCTPAASKKSRRKSTLLKKAKASDVEASRKSGPVSKETPESQKEKVESGSPQSFSFNRSRSGRLLMPTLEFWRNQKATYNADRTITGIDGIDVPPAGGRSTPHGERK